MNPLPAIRHVDLFPIEHEGEQLFCLSDPAGIVDDQMVLTLPAAFLAAQLDGQKDLDEIRNAFQLQFRGATVSDQELSGLVIQLDTAGFLQTETFDHLYEGVVSRFKERPTRPAHLAGKAYPADPEELRGFLDQQFLREGGPGRALPEGPGRGTPLPGLIIPHIDMTRGGHSYAQGYLRLYESGVPDTVLIFGVAHAAEPVPFILTRKAFETPLGALEVDHAFLDAVEPACDFDAYAYEFAHRSEHSVEFQAVMLAHLYGTDLKIVPVLASHFVDPPHLAPGESTPVSRFLNACSNAIEAHPGRVTVLASADLAHVGRRFGDAFDIDEDVIADARRRDTEDFDHVHALRPEDFYASVMQDENARHVCGYNCIYSAVKTLEGIATRAETIHHDHAEDPAGGIVTFAATTIE